MKLQRVADTRSPWPVRPADCDVAQIVADVREQGDVAVERWARRLGDRPPHVIPSSRLHDAQAHLQLEELRIVREAAARIRSFAQAQRAAVGDFEIESAGANVGHRLVPVQTIGVYAPGGRYPLPSTVLMCAIPARVAGVGSIVLCTPDPSPLTLAAAYEAGVDRCVCVGGAQSIAAMAYGTQTIPRVDLIVGPGNAYVTEAKRLVFGQCGIDMLAGPSELLAIASGDANAALVAADLLAQAEHDPDARVMLIAEDEAFIQNVESELECQLPLLTTEHTISVALAENARAAIASLTQAVEIADAIAPEHVALYGVGAESLASAVTHYGTMFIGQSIAPAFGDYGIGPNHVLPTGATARFSSGLSVLTFLQARTFVRGKCDQAALRDMATFAALEGLAAHAKSALLRGTAER